MPSPPNRTPDFTPGARIMWHRRRGYVVERIVYAAVVMLDSDGEVRVVVAAEVTAIGEPTAESRRWAESRLSNGSRTLRQLLARRLAHREDD